MALDLKKIARKWQRQWKTQKVFESDADNSREKFMLTVPYPYVNGYLHIGHTYTNMRVEALARFKRMQGYNVLFPFAFHATGSPIDTAAKKVKDREESQINALKLMGFKEEALPAFEDPVHWIKVFSQAAEHDLLDYGLAIDWRRSFITTDLNPRYSKFVAWQFNKLKKKGYVAKGSHPVVWCPKEKTPVGDHARSEGEGETPQEMVLFKHQLENGKYVVSATIRPDTVLGITNLYLNPKTQYKEIEINGEVWILGEAGVKGLQEQGHELTVKGEVKGEELIGKNVKTYGDKQIPILPATFLDPKVGTGLVHSVPSESADDLIALWDIQKDEETIKKYGLDVKNIEPIPVLITPEYGENSAEEILKKYGVKSQNEREKLEKIRKELYKLSHYTATFNELYRDAFSENLEGKKVEDGKDIIKKGLIKSGFAVVFYQLTGKVVCRCLTECTVKVVENQWFLKYSNKEWKQQVMKCLQGMKLYPEKVRGQFEYVVDWLRDWACTREFGLGTELPWDKTWKIESLSDSTIYNAYYTIAHLLKNITLGKINDKLFDYVFLGEGDPSAIDVDPKLLNQMREEFAYWYPVDFRNSGKDLVQNHLTFYMFIHTAIFPEKYWPRGIGVNGYVSIDKQKMSKSKGVFKTLRDAISAFGPDVTRITILSTGEELNDVDWDTDLAETMTSKLEQWYEFAIKHYAKGEHAGDKKEIDKWMEHQLHTSIKKATNAMELTLFRTAIMKSFFDLQRHLKWYARRTAGNMNKEVLNKIIEAQTLMLQPFTPHVCEEIWYNLGKQGLIANEKWPQYDENKIIPTIEESEALMSRVLEDILHVLKLAKIEKPQRITLFVAEDWKVKLFKKLKEMLAETRDIGQIMKAVLPEMQEHAKEAGQLVPKIVKDPSKLPLYVAHQEAEYQNLLDASEFLKSEYGCTIEVVKEQESEEAKAKQAMPGKPALLVK